MFGAGHDPRRAASDDELLGGGGSAAEEKALEGFEQLLAAERPHVPVEAVGLGDDDVVLEGRVRSLERVVELVADEDEVGLRLGW